MRRAALSAPGASSSPTRLPMSAIPAMAIASSASAESNHSCSTTWCAATSTSDMRAAIVVDPVSAAVSASVRTSM